MRIHRYVARLNRLIGDLVDVTSIDVGKLSVSPARGDLAVLIAEAVDTFHVSLTNWSEIGSVCLWQHTLHTQGLASTSR